MSKFVKHGERGTTLDFKQNGVFDELYSGCSCEVPSALRQCEKLTADLPVVATVHGMLLFAGTVRARPYRFLPYSLFVTNSGLIDIERIAVSIPLGKFFLPKDEYWPDRIVGGGITRCWSDLGYCMLAGGEVVEDEFQHVSMHIGIKEIEEIAESTDTPDVSVATDLLLRLRPELTIATSPIDVITIPPEAFN